ncbi:MAG: glycosyltransferase family 4 protein [Nanoarchaeota archaeon]
MRIVHLRTNFDVNLGYDTLIIPLAHKKMGHDVIVVCSDRQAAFFKNKGVVVSDDAKRRLRWEKEIQTKGYYIYEGIKVYRLYTVFKYDDVAIVKGLRKLLYELKPDLVITVAAKELIALVAAWEKDTLGYAMLTREDQWDFPASTLFRRFLIKSEYLLFRRFLVDYIYKKSDVVLTSTTQGVDFIKRWHWYYPNLTHQVVTVDTSHFHYDQNARQRLRKQWKVKKEDCVVIAAGKVVALKNFEVYIKAVAKSRHKDHLRFFILGGGDEWYIKKLKKLISKSHVKPQFFFYSNVAHDQLYQWFSAADIGIWNRHTASIHEAMATHLPVILPQIVCDQVPQFVAAAYKTGDADDLAHVINAMYENVQERRDLADKAYETIKKIFDVNIQSKKMIELVQPYISSRYIKSL